MDYEHCLSGSTGELLASVSNANGLSWLIGLDSTQFLHPLCSTSLAFCEVEASGFSFVLVVYVIFFRMWVYASIRVYVIVSLTSALVVRNLHAVLTVMIREAPCHHGSAGHMTAVHSDHCVRTFGHHASISPPTNLLHSISSSWIRH